MVSAEDRITLEKYSWVHDSIFNSLSTGLIEDLAEINIPSVEISFGAFLHEKDSSSRSRIFLNGLMLSVLISGKVAILSVEIFGRFALTYSCHA